jgi:hypothetical protein
MSIRTDPSVLLTWLSWGAVLIVLVWWVVAWVTNQRNPVTAVVDDDCRREVNERRRAGWVLRVTLGVVLIAATWAAWLLWRPQYAFKFTERWAVAFALLALVVIDVVIDALVRIFRRNPDGTRVDTGKPVKRMPAKGQRIHDVDEAKKTAALTPQTTAPATTVSTTNTPGTAGFLGSLMTALQALGRPARPAGFVHPITTAPATTPVSTTPATPEASKVAADQPPNDLVWHRRDGIKGLVVGLDGRTSTSKVQFVLWTVAVLFTLSYLLVVAHSPNCTKAIAAGAKHKSFDCPGMRKFDRGGFAAAAGGGFPSELLVLLGLPAGAAIVAKQVTSNNPAKEEATSGNDAGIAAGLSQIVSKDTSGDLDLLDFQYFVFNLVALGYFLLQFLTKPQAGLPEVPSALLVLSGVSTASYVAKTTLAGGQAGKQAG